MSKNNTLKNLTLVQLKRLLPKELFEELHNECNFKINDLEAKLDIMQSMNVYSYRTNTIIDFIRYLDEKKYFDKYHQFILGNIEPYRFSQDLSFYFLDCAHQPDDYIKLFKVIQPLYQNYQEYYGNEDKMTFYFYQNEYPNIFLNYLRTLDYVGLKII